MSTPVKDRLHGLIERLDDEQAARAIEVLNGLVDHAPVDRVAADLDAASGSPPIISGRAFQRQPPTDWLALAAEQGVRPIGDLQELVGDFWPEGEAVDDFIAAVREWRREGGRD